MADKIEPADELSEDKAATMIRPYGFENDWSMSEAMLPEDLRIPLNLRDVVISRMRGMSEDELERVISAAGILYWETGEGHGILDCLYAATEYERKRDAS